MPLILVTFEIKIMKKIYPALLFLSLLSSVRLQAQGVPVMNPIQGPAFACSSPASPNSFTASASNSPTSYFWTVSSPATGVSFSSPSASVCAIGFPYPYANVAYTVYCSASNSFGTSQTASFVVQVFETPSVTFSGAQNFCQGSSTQLSASPTIVSASSTLFYNWTPATGLSSTTSSSVIANPNVTTTYTVLLSIGNCTNSTQLTLLVYPCTVGLDKVNNEKANDLIIYPNPNQGSFFIKSAFEEKAVIINELGQSLQHIQLLPGTETGIQGLPPGIYFIVTPRTRCKFIVSN